MTTTLEQRAAEMARMDTGRLAWRNLTFEQFFLQHLQEAVGSAADAVYLERNQVVAALAKTFPSGITKTAIEGWAPEWHNCVYIDLPTGQVSWHYHDREAHLFAGLPAYIRQYDGHTTTEKYERVDALPLCQQPHKDTMRLRTLRLLCGYVENGTSGSVTIAQDDATRDWIVKSGPKHWWYGYSLAEALDQAYADARKND